MAVTDTGGAILINGNGPVRKVAPVDASGALVSGGAFAFAAASTILMPAAATSARAPVAVPAGGQVRVVNAGSADARVEFGSSSIAATVPTSGTLTSGTYTGGAAGSVLVKAATAEVFTVPAGCTHAAITATGTTTIEFTPGTGL